MSRTLTDYPALTSCPEGDAFCTRCNPVFISWSDADRLVPSPATIMESLIACKTTEYPGFSCLKCVFDLGTSPMALVPHWSRNVPASYRSSAMSPIRPNISPKNRLIRVRMSRLMPLSTFMVPWRTYTYFVLSFQVSSAGDRGSLLA